MLGEDAPARHLTHLVPRAPDALQPPRHRTRRLDLQHEVDRAHVDAQLQRAGGDDAAQQAGLEHLLDLLALIARDGAVVRAHQGLRRRARRSLWLVEEVAGRRGRGRIVDALSQALAQAAAVGEHDGGAVGADQLHQARHDGRPDAALLLREHLDRRGRRRGRRQLARGGATSGPLARRRRGRGEGALALRPFHLLHRHLDGEIEAGHLAGVDDADRTVAAEVTRHLLQRSLGGRQSDALRLAPDERLQPLQRERQVHPTLARRQCVDLVDNHRLDAGERTPRLGAEHEVQRLGRGHQDVARVARDLPALALRSVTGTHRHPHVAQRHAQPLGGPPDAHQRRAQVALHVIGKRLERRDIQRTHRRGRARFQPQRAVEAEEKRRQRLAAPRRSSQQRMLPGSNARPPGHLHPSRPRERRSKPLPRSHPKGRQRIEATLGLRSHWNHRRPGPK